MIRTVNPKVGPTCQFCLIEGVKDTLFISTPAFTPTDIARLDSPIWANVSKAGITTRRNNRKRFIINYFAVILSIVLLGL